MLFRMPDAASGSEPPAAALPVVVSAVAQALGTGNATAISTVTSPMLTLADAAPIAANRKMRRALEKARRKRDKLVEPKLDHVEAVAERPPPALERKQKKKKQKKIEGAVIDDPNDILIADELIEGDGQGDVLFEQSEFHGEFNFRDSILDQLERYWFYLERMRRHSGETYDLYRQLGASLVPRCMTGYDRKPQDLFNCKWSSEELERYKAECVLSPWFKKVRPSWGCIAYGTDPRTEEVERNAKIVVPRFLYFTKYKRPPPEIQPMPGGTIYKLTVWWDTPLSKNGQRKWGIPNDIPIFVSDDCKQILPLRSLDTRMVRVAKRGNNFDYHLIPQRAWSFPPQYEEWSALFGLTVDLHLPHIFCRTMQDFEECQYSMARVNVLKGDLCANFGINPRRLAYFFRDRDIIVTVSGQRKRIMHYVRPHIREDGTAIRAHFRGAREFSWAGYNVLITIPGRDHFVLPEFNAGTTDAFWIQPDNKRWVTEKEMGRRLAAVVRGAPIKELAKGDTVSS
jgi:hypothetical protein